MNKKIINQEPATANEVKSQLHIPVINSRKKSIVIDNFVTVSSLNSEIKVKDLFIDLSYQRIPNERKVITIVNNFNPDAIGVLICSMREDGTIAVIDGGHRVAALRMLNKENSNVNCLVYFGLSLEEEAQIFTKMNDNRTKPKTGDIFKSKVIGGDKDAIEINDILNKFNLNISNKPSNNSIRAIGTLSSTYKKYGRSVIVSTIDTIIKSFGSHSSSMTDSAILSISKIYATYDIKSINQTRLINVLISYGNVSIWRNRSHPISESLGYKEHIGMAIALINEYNKKLKSNRLDSSKLT